MDTRTAVIGAAGVAAAGTLVASRRRSAPQPRPDRWHVVTINRPMAEVGDALRGWPTPVSDLGDVVEVRATPAPGGRGTELAVRARPGGRTRGKRRAELDERIRLALRHSRSLVETGDVLLPDAPSTTQPTLTSLPLQAAIRRARREGRL